MWDWGRGGLHVCAWSRAGRERVPDSATAPERDLCRHNGPGVHLDQLDQTAVLFVAGAYHAGDSLGVHLFPAAYSSRSLAGRLAQPKMFGSSVPAARLCIHLPRWHAINLHLQRRCAFEMIERTANLTFCQSLRQPERRNHAGWIGDAFAGNIVSRAV